MAAPLLINTLLQQGAAVTRNFNGFNRFFPFRFEISNLKSEILVPAQP
jgi:hypothetical protein